MSDVSIRSEAGRGARVPAEGDVSAPPSVCLELPAPPSVNEIWRKTRAGMRRSPRYVEWQMEAGWRLKAQKPRSIAGPVLVLVSVERHSNSADIDNRVKALFDLIVHHGVIEDDSRVAGFCAAWAPPANRLARLMILPASRLDLSFHLAADGATGGWFCNALTNLQEA